MPDASSGPADAGTSGDAPSSPIDPSAGAGAPKGAAAKPAAPAPRKWEPVEIDDEDDLDKAGKPKKIRYETEQDFKLAMKKFRGADRRFEEAANLRKEASSQKKLADDFLEAFKSDPGAAMLEFGEALKIDRSKLTAAMKAQLDRQAEFEKIPEEDRKFLEETESTKRELAKLRKQQAEAAEGTKREAFQRQVAENDKRFMDEHMAVLGEMPEYSKEFAEERVLPLVAEVQRLAHEGGYKLSPKAAANEARKMIGTFVSSHLQQMPPEHFTKVAGERLAKMTVEDVEKMLGPERVTALAQRKAASLRGAPIQQRGTAKPLPAEEKKKHGWDGTAGGYADEPYYPVKPT